jgi:glutathione S-transferase
MCSRAELLCRSSRNNRHRALHQTVRLQPIHLTPSHHRLLPLNAHNETHLLTHYSSKGLGAPDAARVAQAERDLEAVLAYYEGVLQGQRYLAGDDMSLVDLFHLPNGAALKAGRWKELFERYPAVDRWFEGLRRREAWVRAAAEAGTVA